MVGMISSEEVKNLANLARLELSDEETEKFKTDISSVLDYVDSINAAEVEDGGEEHELLNIFREDTVTNEPDEYTEALLEAAPEREGRYLKVHKILAQDE
jgi:aspartyl-tRNA(Asn)/glutamyl-tRNA(Gln) amidotransferase subunit C